MVSESVGIVMSVKMRWHADFHSNVFMKVHQELRRMATCIVHGDDYKVEDIMRFANLRTANIT